MSFLPNQEQAMLRDSARAFLSEQAPVARLRSLRDQADGPGFDPDLWRRFAELGFPGLLTAEAQGGLGLGHAELVLLMEEVGRHLSVLPFAASSVVAASALAAAASPEQAARWLPGLAEGSQLASLAVNERARHAPWHIGLRAEPAADGQGWVLQGDKRAVEFGQAADVFVVAARSAGEVGDQDGISLFVVPANSAGLSVEPVTLVDGQRAAHLRFDRVQVPADALLGSAGQGAQALQKAMDVAALAGAAELLGVADESLARTLAYLKERRQFERIIGEFQALQHRAAELMVDIELARAAVGQAAQALDAGASDVSAAVSVAKARAGRSATRAVQEGVQMHGGIGMTDEFEIGFFMKRARVLQERWGDDCFHTDRLARLNGY